MANWVEGTVVERIHWHNDLFSLHVSAELPEYHAGQFTRLGLDLDGSLVSRAYSFVNPPGAPLHQFLITRVPGGKLSPDLSQLHPGQTLQLASPATGYLTLEEVPEAENLWLMATGTGVGPFLSILGAAPVWRRFRQVVLVYAVRRQQDLAYLANIQQLQQRYPQQFHFVPVISRKAMCGALRGRIPALLSTEQLQQHSGVTLNPATSQVMLCGNPQMLSETTEVLKTMGLHRHRRRNPGHLHAERYW